MGITIVTTTHNRAFCFSLLEKWVANQTVKPDQWLVINDSPNPDEYRYNYDQEVVIRKPDQDTLPSICENWLVALPRIKHDLVLVFEDDDWYSPDYIETMAGLLKDAELAGISDAIYYKLPSRRIINMYNREHASLAATGFRRSVCSEVERVCKEYGNVFIDMGLWNDYQGSKKLLPQPRKNGSVYIMQFKLMPGGRGLGIGHMSPYCGTSDPNFWMLKEYIGPAHQVYKRVWQERFSKP